MKEKKPIYKKWWFWVIVVFLLIGIAGSRSGNNPEEFSTFNWDNLKGTKIYDVFSSSCTEFYIAPGILSNVSTDKVIYYN